MRRLRSVATVAMATSAVLASGISGLSGFSGMAEADAASSTLYVDGSSATCSDSGAGTSDTPFCTIQAGADAAVAGDTVDIAAGTYTGAVDISSVGTAAAPIVFKAVGFVRSIDAADETGPALTFSGASYVTLEGFDGTAGSSSLNVSTGDIEVDGSTHLSLDSVIVGGDDNTVTGPTAVHVDGTSSDVTLSRSFIIGGSVGLQIDAGGSGDIVTTNLFDGNGSGVSVAGTAGTAITSNDFEGARAGDNTVDLTSGATGTTVENNIFTGAGPNTAYPGSAVFVDATSVSGTTVDYNIMYPGNFQHAYAWDGALYSTPTAFTQATAQGAHDISADPSLNGDVDSFYADTAQENSADSSAPGMLSTDLYGDACTGNPLLPATGTGTPDYCARGAFQPNYSVETTASPTAVTATSVSLQSWVSESMTDADRSISALKLIFPGVSYTIDWGDGHSQTVQASTTTAATVTTHTYAKTGTYTITQTANPLRDSGGTTTAQVTTAGAGYTAYGPKRLLDTRHGIGATAAKVSTGQAVDLKVAGVDSIPANVSAVAVNLTVTDTSANGYVALGGTTVQTSNVNYLKGQTIANSAIVPVNADGGIEVTNEGNAGGTADMIVDVTGYFVRGSGTGYAPLNPDRLLDTRHGTGAPTAKVRANTGLPVTIAGADSIPAGVSAVALHVTVTDTTGNGWIAAEPDGAGTPSTSTLNYLKGQTVSNTIIVPVASDGKIELYNGGGNTPVDLIADVSGYFDTAASEAYIPVTAFRAFDSRDQGELYPDTADELGLADFVYDGTSATNAFPAGATMITNLTMTQEQQNGYITDYPGGTSRPNTSAVNFLAGQTVANLSLVGSTGATQQVDFYNRSSGYDDLIVDVLGYFANT